MSAYKLVPAKDDDFHFLREVHHATLKDHVQKIWGWDEKQQDEMYREAFDSSRVNIIFAGETPAGYLELDEQQDFATLLNILILPEFQGRGIGTNIITGLAHDSKKAGKELRLGVFKVNARAKRLYESLGFAVYETTETHFLMKVLPR